MFRFFFAIFLFIPIKGIAFEPLNTDDAGTVKASGNQIEQYFFSISRHGSTGPLPVDFVTPGEEFFGQNGAKAYPFTYSRGLSENLEASITSTYYTKPSGTYTRVSNTAIAMKWRFLEDENNRFAFAIKPVLIFPASQQQQIYGLGASATNYGLNIIASRYWESIESHMNASYMRSPYNTNYAVGQSMDQNRLNIFFLSIAPVWTVIPGIKLAIDVGATTNPPVPEPYLNYYVLLGIILTAKEDIDIGLSAMRSAANYGTVISANGPNATRSEIGVTWRF